jgi:hypothetical protein
MLEAHLAGCDHCRGYKASMGRIACGLGNLSAREAPRDFAASVSFQLGRERTRRRWTPIAAAAAVMVGFVVARPYLMGGDAAQFATADLGKAAFGAKIAAQAPGVVPRQADGRRSTGQEPGGSLLDGMAAHPAEPPAEQQAGAPAAEPQVQSPTQIALQPAVSGGVSADRHVTALLPQDRSRDDRPLQVAAAPRPESAAMSNAGPALDANLAVKENRLAAIARESEAKKAEMTGAAEVAEMAEVAAEKDKEAADIRKAPDSRYAADDAMSRIGASGGAGGGAGSAGSFATAARSAAAAPPVTKPAPAAQAALPPGAAIAAYRTADSAGARSPERPAVRAAAKSDESRRKRSGAAPRKPMTRREQHQVDMATFEALRWLDPTAEGGADLELREVDFTVP